MTRRHRSLRPLALVASLMCAACATDVDPAPVTEADVTASLEAGRAYLAAVVAADPAALSELVFYLDESTAPATAVSGLDLPSACLVAEIDAMSGLGVSAGSTVEIVEFGASADELDGSPAFQPYTVRTVQLGLPGGGSEGRGVVSTSDGHLIQIPPGDECDAALEAQDA